MGKRKSTAEDKAGEMDVDGDSSDDVGRSLGRTYQCNPISQNEQKLMYPQRTHP
jgi:hypothetical protein